MKKKEQSIEIYQTKDKKTQIDVKFEGDTVWLSLNQISELFGRDKSVISRHINNIYKEGELLKRSTVAKNATVQIEADREVRRIIEYYNLDAILSVGYRVNSKRGTQFRQWATQRLKEHLIRGYTLNQQRLQKVQKNFLELQETILFLKEKSGDEIMSGQEKEVLSLLADYSRTLTLLEKYDKGKLAVSRNAESKYNLSFEESTGIIKRLKEELIRKKEASQLFGRDNENNLKSIIGSIYQTFAGKELYESLEEKAAHLLYFIVKDHPFTNGNKRIGSFLFVYFLDKNDFLYKETGEKKINDNALTALALLIAVSEPKDKDKLIKIITSLISL